MISALSICIDFSVKVNGSPITYTPPLYVSDGACSGCRTPLQLSHSHNLLGDA
ncbi:MAG TPA: hypothetical protein DC044_00270 [Roseburia sp.]|nr:hypothetical protein [Roseburia sp.]